MEVLQKREQTVEPTESDSFSKAYLPARSNLAALLTLAALAPFILGGESVATTSIETVDPLINEPPPRTLTLDAQSMANYDSTSFTLKSGDKAFIVDTTGNRSGLSAAHDSPARSGPSASVPVSQTNSLVGYVVKGGALTLGCLGAIGAMRGTAKVGSYVTERLGDREKFIGRECLETPSCNFHVLKEIDGKLVLDVSSIDKPELDDIFRNGYADRVFRKALDLCTPEQPFPSLNFDRASSHLIEDKVGFFRGKDKESPTLLLEEINKLLRDSYSALYGEGIVAHGMNLPVHRDVHVLIPICEVSAQGERDLVFAVISQSDFDRCAQLPSGPSVEVAQGSQTKRVDQLRAAYAEQQAFKTKYGQELFPTVTVFIKV